MAVHAAYVQNDVKALRITRGMRYRMQQKRLANGLNAAIYAPRFQGLFLWPHSEWDYSDREHRSACWFHGHRDKVFLELKDGDATTGVEPACSSSRR